VLCGALRCFAAWVMGASRRLMPVLCGALRARGQSPSHALCFAVLCGLGRGGQSASHTRSFAVLCLLGHVVESSSHARCFVVLCGALRAMGRRLAPHSPARKAPQSTGHETASGPHDPTLSSQVARALSGNGGAKRWCRPLGFRFIDCRAAGKKDGLEDSNL